MVNKCAILLVRVSTMVQDYEPQVADLKKYAKTKGYSRFKIIETIESGLIDFDKKSGTNQLFSFIQENPQYKAVFATEISRLGRRQSVLHQIKEWLVKNKIQLYVKDIGYALLDESGKVSIGGDMMFSMYGFFAEAEIQQKKDRFRRSKQRLMEIGYSISGKTLFGYEKVKGEGDKNTYKLNEENANVVRTIFNWYLTGIDAFERNVSVKRIVLECIKMSFPKYTHSKRNVNKLLKEEGYTGEKTTNNKRKNINYEEGGTEEKYIITNNKIKYPIIIDKETFTLTQKRLKENNTKAEKSTIYTTILSKLIKCAKCNNHYGGNYRLVNGRNLHTYRCNCRNSIGKIKNTQSISMSMIDSAIWSLIKIDLTALSKVISNYNPDKHIAHQKKSKKILEKRLDEIDEEIKTLDQSLKSFSNYKNVSIKTFIDTIQAKLLKLNKESGSIKNEISKIEVSLLATNSDFNNLFESIKPNLDLIEESKDLLKKYINLLVEEIGIVFHNQQYSIIKVKFKINNRSKTDFNKVKLFPGVIPLLEIESTTNIILDKRDSQRIKAYKTNLVVEKAQKAGKVLFSQVEGKYSRSFEISLSDITEPTNNRFFKNFSFRKLNVYVASQKNVSQKNKLVSK